MITKIDSKNPNPLLKLIEPIHTYHETNEIIFETYRPLLTIRHGIDHNERVQLSVYWNLKVGVVEFPKRSLLHPLLMICYHGRPRCFRFDRRETKAGQGLARCAICNRVFALGRNCQGRWSLSLPRRLAPFSLSLSLSLF